MQEYVNDVNIKVTTISDSSINNPGDALRELHKKDVVKSDPFILMSGDIITNADLKPAIENHKKRAKKDANNIMTVILKEVRDKETRR